MLRPSSLFAKPFTAAAAAVANFSLPIDTSAKPSLKTAVTCRCSLAAALLILLLFCRIHA